MNKFFFAISFSIWFIILNFSKFEKNFKELGLIEENIQEKSTEIDSKFIIKDVLDGVLSPSLNNRIEKDILNSEKPKYEIELIYSIGTDYGKDDYESIKSLVMANNYKFEEVFVNNGEKKSLVKLTIKYKDVNNEMIQTLKNKRMVGKIKRFVDIHCNSNLRNNDKYNYIIKGFDSMSFKYEYQEKIIDALLKKIKLDCEDRIISKSLDHKILSYFMKDEDIPDFFKNLKDKKIDIPEKDSFRDM